MHEPGLARPNSDVNLANYVRTGATNGAPKFLFDGIEFGGHYQ